MVIFKEERKRKMLESEGDIYRINMDIFVGEGRGYIELREGNRHILIYKRLGGRDFFKSRRVCLCVNVGIKMWPIYFSNHWQIFLIIENIEL